MALATAQRLEVDEWTVRCRICSSGNDDEHHIQYHAQRINFLPEIEKRLDINHTIYPGSGNYSQFTFDGYGHVVKIVETSGGSITSTKQFVQIGGNMKEARDGTGNLLSQYFSLGQLSSSTNYFYQLTHRGDVVGVTNNSGAQVSAVEYDPYGRPTVLSGSFTPDFCFTGLYLHQRSGLNLATYRAYNPTLGRWINRDPIGENGRINLYGYAANNAVSLVDWDGTSMTVVPIFGGPIGYPGLPPKGPPTGYTPLPPPGPPTGFTPLPPKGPPTGYTPLPPRRFPGGFTPLPPKRPKIICNSGTPKQDPSEQKPPQEPIQGPWPLGPVQGSPAPKPVARSVWNRALVQRSLAKFSRYYRPRSAAPF